MAHIPYGYIIEKGKAKTDKVKAEQVVFFFMEYVSGATLQAAADTSGIKRGHGTLGRMIDRGIYKGDGFYPAIIDDELCNKAQAERKRRVESLGRNTKCFLKDDSAVSLFNGLVFCVECGSEYRLYANNGKARFKCSGRAKNKKSCSNSLLIPESGLETAFIRMVSKINVSAIVVKPKKSPVVMKVKYDDPFRQAEYIYSRTRIDDFEYQTEKLLTALRDTPIDFNGRFLKMIIKRIEVPHDGPVVFVLINDKRIREDLNKDGKP